MSADRVLRGAALALAAMLLCVAFSAEARLIRNGGRATVSNNSAKYVLLVDDTRISGDFLILDDSSRPDQDGSANLATMESGSERIYTVPDECFTFVGSSEQQEEFNAANEDCRYEFLEGEPLEFLGFMDHFLPGAFVDIQWSLTSPDSAFSFDFPGEITSFDTESDFTSTTAVLNLSVDAPPGLVPGEYEIAARSIQTAPAGFSFFEYAFVTPTACDVPIFGPDEPTVCLLGGESFGDTFSNSSLGTQVTILPGGAPPVLTVPAPSTLSLLVASFGAAIGFRRRRRVPEQGQRLRLLRA